MEEKKDQAGTPPPEPTKLGRPLVDRVIPTHHAKQKALDKYIYKHINKTIKQLELLEASGNLFVIEAIAIGILLRAARRGDAAMIEMVMHTNVGKKFRVTKPRERDRLREEAKLAPPPEPTPILPEDAPEEEPLVESAGG